MKKIIFENKDVKTIIFDDLTKDDIILVKKDSMYFGTIVYCSNTNEYICSSKLGNGHSNSYTLEDAMKWFGDRTSFYIP